MNDLIPLDHHDDGTIAVSMRNLHAGLDVATSFTDWAKRMFAYGFEEGADYTEISLLKSGERVHGGQNRRDWALTLDAAKEIAMVQRTERGQQVRRYFIAKEKELRAQQPAELTGPELMARALIEAQSTLEAATKELEVARPKAESFDAFLSSNGDYSVNEAAKILARRHGIKIGAGRLGDLLGEWKWTFRRDGRPAVMQTQIETGRLAERAQMSTDWKTGQRVARAPQVRITPKGVDAIARRLIDQQSHTPALL